MKKIIENKLQSLIGLGLTKTNRIINMECLKFGFKEKELKTGNIVNVGEYGLHIQCEWRIIQGKIMIVGSSDLYEPNVDNACKRNFNYEKGNLRDEKMSNLINKNNLIVQEIEADNFGGAIVRLSKNYSLQIIPLNTSDSEYNEYWRLLNNIEEEKNHFVIGRKEIKTAANNA